MILFVFCNFISYSQEIVLDSIVEDSMDYYDDVIDSYDSVEQEYSGYISFLSIQYKHNIVSTPVSFQYNPFGFDVGLYKQFNSDLPFFLGITLSMDMYGSESYQYYDYGFEDGYEYRFSDDFRGYIVNVDMGGKYFSKRSFWVFNPYIQLDLEYRYAFAAINTVNLDLDEMINTNYEGGNSGLGYAFGFGSLIDINSDGLFLNFSINYNSGGGLFLYNKKYDNDMILSVLDNFDYKHFPIGFLTFKLGISFSK